MKRAVIVKFWPRGDRKPGRVDFDNGDKLSTFDGNVLAGAERGVGQTAEYETETNGQYTNLASLKLLGFPEQSPVPHAPPPPPSMLPGPIMEVRPDPSFARIAAALEGIAAVMKSGVAVFHVPVLPDGPPMPPAQLGADPVAVVQEKLADAVGDEAAAAMFEALRKKHKTAEKLEAAAVQLLKAHDLEA